MSRLDPNWDKFLYLAAFFAVFFFVQHLDNTDHSSEWARASELEAVQQEEAARASREFAGQQVCGPGARADWMDDKTLVCVPKRGKSWEVAEVK